MNEEAPEPASGTSRASEPTETGGRERAYTLLGVAASLLAASLYYFFFVRPARVAPATAVARFTSLVGRVSVKSADRESWIAAEESTVLKTRDQVRTEARAAAEITFFNGNVLKVRPDSLILIEEPVQQGQGQAAALRLDSGRVNFDVQQATEIATLSQRTTAESATEGEIDVAQAGDTTVKIFRGSAQVDTREGERVVLGTNEGVSIDLKGKPGRKLTLPPAPNTLAPAALAELLYRPPPEVTALLEWEKVVEGVKYHLAMDYNVVQANLLLSAAMDQPDVEGTAHELKGLDEGKYFWRVAAVSQEGAEGAFSKVSTFSVLKQVAQAAVETPASPPELDVAPLEVLAGLVHVQGRTEPGATVTLGGVAVPVENDGSFSEFVQWGGRPTLLIRAESKGGVSEQVRRLAAR